MRVIVGLENSPIIPHELEIIHIVQDPQSPTWNTRSHQDCLTWNPRAISLISKMKCTWLNHICEQKQDAANSCWVARHRGVRTETLLSLTWCCFGQCQQTASGRAALRKMFSRPVTGLEGHIYTASDCAGPAHQTYKRDLGGKMDSPNPTYTATMQTWTDPQRKMLRE